MRKALSLSTVIVRSLKYECFADRHIGPSQNDVKVMLDLLGFEVRIWLFDLLFDNLISSLP